MSSEDFKSQALNSEHDFYALLGLTEGAGEGEIRRAYRQTARLYHPDKLVDASTAEKEAASEKFHLVGIAYEVLQEPEVKALYDRTRQARRQKEDTRRAYEGHRKHMIDELERRERESGAFKRKRTDDEEKFDQELRRLAADGKRRREERTEQLRREAEAEEVREQQEEQNAPSNGSASQEVKEDDRTISLRFPRTKETDDIDETTLRSRFERFGMIDLVLIREKKVKIDGQKHRQPYAMAVLQFKSIVGAHAAVSDFEKIQKAHPHDFSIFENVSWAAGKEPDCIPKTTKTTSKPSSKTQQEADELLSRQSIPRISQPNAYNNDDIMMIRLKNAQRKREEDKARREEAAAVSGLNSTTPSFGFKPKVVAATGTSTMDDESRKAEARRKAIEEIKRQDAAEDAATADGIAQ